MADSTIPNLPAFSGTPNGTEEMETVQSGVSVKITSQKVADLATIVTPITKAALIALGGANQISVYKLYLITNATAGRLLVKGLTTSTIEDGVLNMTTGQSGTYVLGTDTFTAAGGGNANITPISAAALLALPSFSTTTIYVVTDAPLRISIQAETTSQLGQTGTIVDDVYSGVVDYDLATNTFLNGTIYDGNGNTWNGCLPSGTTLGASSAANVFLTSGTNTFGTSARRNIIKQGVTGFILGDNFQNTTIEPDVLGADYTASPDYDFLYNGESCVIFTDGTDNYHMNTDPANNRFVLVNLTTLAVSYIGGSGGGDMILASAQTNSGLKTFLDGSFGLRNIANTFTSFFANAATSARTWTLQNRNGTLADDTDLALKANKAGDSFTGAINEAQGTNIASATTTDIGAATGNYVVVTGTTTITGLGTVQAGTRRIVNFSGILTLTHNGTSLILPTAANITTAAGDTATFVSLGSGNWVCVNYMRASGAALVGGGATQDPIASCTAGTAVTGTTSNTYSKGLLIPAGSRTDNDAPQIDMRIAKTGTAGTVTMRYYWNTTNDLAGSPILIATIPAAVAATLSNQAPRILAIEVATGGSKSTRVVAAATGIQTDSIALSVAQSSLAIDWAIDGYLICAVQNASAADSTVCNMIKLH